MPKFYCVACQGLDEFAVGQPVEVLAAFLNRNTPDGVHFPVVGGVDPQLVADQIIADLIAAAKSGAVVIFVGHSKGAMLAFYAADALKAAGLYSPLFISIDSTEWGSNVPGALQWAIVPSAFAGKWLVPDNIANWLHFRQPAYPGGGVASLAPGNTTTQFQNFERTESHVALPDTPTVEQIILQAVLAIVENPQGASH